MPFPKNFSSQKLKNLEKSIEQNLSTNCESVSVWQVFQSLSSIFQITMLKPGILNLLASSCPYIMANVETNNT